MSSIVGDEDETKSKIRTIDVGVRCRERGIRAVEVDLSEYCGDELKCIRGLRKSSSRIDVIVGVDSDIGLIDNIEQVERLRNECRLLTQRLEGPDRRGDAGNPYLLAPEALRFAMEMKWINIVNEATIDAEPSSKDDVFRDLWDRGFYLRSGIKFGGEFLAYSGTRPLSSSSRSFFVIRIVCKRSTRSRSSDVALSVA